MLSMLGMERRTGSVKVESDGKVATFGLANGEVWQVTVGGKERDPVEGMREVLRWTRGSFAFSPGGPPVVGGRSHSLGVLLIEAMKREDEATH